MHSADPANAMYRRAGKCRKFELGISEGPSITGMGIMMIRPAPLAMAIRFGGMFPFFLKRRMIATKPMGESHGVGQSKKIESTFPFF